MREACAEAKEPLTSIFPGSWINADFYIWIGHPDDHRAWGQLVDARRALETPAPGLSATALARAREEMLIAEGSDWFWWYGDDHSSDHDLEFDELFRRHVRNVYRALEKPIPEELFVTNITTQAPDAVIHRPTGFIEPVIDGEVTNYFEWVGAGCVESANSAGAMHQVSEQRAGINLVEFGFDLENLYLRVDGQRPMTELLGTGLTLAVRFLKPVGVRVVVEFLKGVTTARLHVRPAHGDWRETSCPGLAAGMHRVLELQVPFSALGATAGDPIAFFVVLTRDTTEIEHHPRHLPIEFEVPDRTFAARNWTA
jgi:hypothetical protein